MTPTTAPPPDGWLTAIATSGRRGDRPADTVEATSGQTRGDHHACPFPPLHRLSGGDGTTDRHPLAVIAADKFDDVPDSNIFHDDIAWLADADVTRGCNPPDNTQFCPDDNVTRGQMAAFMNRLANNRVVH